MESSMKELTSSMNSAWQALRRTVRSSRTPVTTLASQTREGKLEMRSLRDRRAMLRTLAYWWQHWRRMARTSAYTDDVIVCVVTSSLKCRIKTLLT